MGRGADEARRGLAVSREGCSARGTRRGAGVWVGGARGHLGTRGDSRGRDCWRRVGPGRGRRGATVTVRSENLSPPSPREGRPLEHPSLCAGTRCCDLGLDQRGSRGLQDCKVSGLGRTASLLADSRLAAASQPRQVFPFLLSGRGRRRD